jgi:hypothetical protein
MSQKGVERGNRPRLAATRHPRVPQTCPTTPSNVSARRAQISEHFAGMCRSAGAGLSPELVAPLAGGIEGFDIEDHIDEGFF